MREKAIERRSVNKEHNSNFKAGYVPIEEERLHKTGLRGRKGIIAIGIIILLFLLALINLIVSLSVLCCVCDINMKGYTQKLASNNFGKKDKTFSYHLSYISTTH